MLWGFFELTLVSLQKKGEGKRLENHEFFDQGTFLLVFFWGGEVCISGKITISFIDSRKKKVQTVQTLSMTESKLLVDHFMWGTALATRIS